MEDDKWKQQETVVAVQGYELGEWEYIVYSSWDEAIAAVKAAHLEGKAAVIYDGSTPSIPPELGK